MEHSVCQNIFAIDVETFASRHRLWRGVLAISNIIMFSSPTFNKNISPHNATPGQSWRREQWRIWS